MTFIILFNYCSPTLEADLGTCGSGRTVTVAIVQIRLGEERRLYLIVNRRHSPGKVLRVLVRLVPGAGGGDQDHHHHHLLRHRGARNHRRAGA